jgi:hypothetical protein
MKRCQKKDCNNLVTKHFHKYCDDCFIPRAEKCEKMALLDE